MRTAFLTIFRLLIFRNATSSLTNLRLSAFLTRIWALMPSLFLLSTRHLPIHCLLAQQALLSNHTIHSLHLHPITTSLIRKPLPSKLDSLLPPSANL